MRRKQEAELESKGESGVADRQKARKGVGIGWGDGETGVRAWDGWQTVGSRD